MRTLEPNEFDIRSAPHLQENVRRLGSKVIIAQVLDHEYKDSDGLKYTEFSLIAAVDNKWIRISMEEYLKSTITNGEHYVDLDGELQFPSELEIVSSCNRTDIRGNEYFYFKAYKGQFEYSKQNGILHHALISTDLYPEHRYGKVQDYTFKIVE